MGGKVNIIEDHLSTCGGKVPPVVARRIDTLLEEHVHARVDMAPGHPRKKNEIVKAGQRPAVQGEKITARMGEAQLKGESHPPHMCSVAATRRPVEMTDGVSGKSVR
jgi:hypothetical protein